MITMDSIPRDASGLVKGEFFLRYASESFSESIGRVAFRNGRSVNKVGGRDLLRLVAAVGPDLSFEADEVAELKPDPTIAERDVAAGEVLADASADVPTIGAVSGDPIAPPETSDQRARRVKRAPNKPPQSAA